MYHVDVVNNGSSVFNVRSNDAEITIDTKGKGITPPDTLLASVGSCLGVYIRKYAEGAKIPLNSFTIAVDADFVKEGPLCFKEIRVAIDLKDAAIDERRKRALLEFIKNCPVHNTLKMNPVVNIEIK